MKKTILILLCTCIFAGFIFVFAATICFLMSSQDRSGQDCPEVSITDAGEVVSVEPIISNGFSHDTRMTKIETTTYILVVPNAIIQYIKKGTHVDVVSKQVSRDRCMNYMRLKGFNQDLWLGPSAAHDDVLTIKGETKRK